MYWIVGLTDEAKRLAICNTHDQAAEYIGGLPGHEDGRYYIDGPIHHVIEIVNLTEGAVMIAVFTSTIVVEFDKSDDDATAAHDALNEYIVEHDISKSFELTRIEEE